MGLNVIFVILPMTIVEDFVILGVKIEHDIFKISIVEFIKTGLKKLLPNFGTFSETIFLNFDKTITKEYIRLIILALTNKLINEMNRALGHLCAHIG